MKFVLEWLQSHTTPILHTGKRLYILLIFTCTIVFAGVLSFFLMYLRDVGNRVHTTNILQNTCVLESNEIKCEEIMKPAEKIMNPAEQIPRNPNRNVIWMIDWDVDK
jgi:hypothetical protein